MSTQREVLQQALEALERADKISGHSNNRKTITAIRAALAEHTPSGDAEDAARYRWLRKNELMAKIQYMTPPTPEGIDAAIDARRKEDK